MRTGRPRKTAKPKAPVLNYQEVAERCKDSDIITIHYDGICKSGHWYEDHMLKMFAQCKMVHLYGNEYRVEEFPKKGA